MRLFSFNSAQWLNRPLDEIFAFFSDARNLQTITPPWLKFEIKTPDPITMKQGTLIDYRLRLHGFPIAWRTKIEVWDPPFRFVDVQLRGPYRVWRHEHIFEEEAGRTHVFDHVQYAVAGGRWVQKLFVERDVARIFQFRRRRLEEIFP